LGEIWGSLNQYPSNIDGPLNRIFKAHPSIRQVSVHQYFSCGPSIPIKPWTAHPSIPSQMPNQIPKSLHIPHHLSGLLADVLEVTPTTHNASRGGPNGRVTAYATPTLTLGQPNAQRPTPSEMCTQRHLLGDRPCPTPNAQRPPDMPPTPSKNLPTPSKKFFSARSAGRGRGEGKEGRKEKREEGERRGREGEGGKGGGEAWDCC